PRLVSRRQVQRSTTRPHDRRDCSRRKMRCSHWRRRQARYPLDGRERATQFTGGLISGRNVVKIKRALSLCCAIFAGLAAALLPSAAIRAANSAPAIAAFDQAFAAINDY